MGRMGEMWERWKEVHDPWTGNLSNQKYNLWKSTKGNPHNNLTYPNKLEI